MRARARTTLNVIRHEVDAILADVTIPDPFDIDEFCRLLAERRGRPIHLVAMGASPLSGAWLALPGADYIFYNDQTSSMHRENIILHEVGHLLFCHKGPEELGGPNLELLKALMPNLPDDLLRRALGRTGYSNLEERQAEMFASRVWQQAGRGRMLVRSGPAPSAEDEHVINRIADVIGEARG
jgi:hypothetical protein